MPRNISKHTDTLIHVRVHPLSLEANLEDATCTKIPPQNLPRLVIPMPRCNLWLISSGNFPLTREHDPWQKQTQPQMFLSAILFARSLFFSPLRRSIAYRARFQTFSLFLLWMSWRLCKKLPPLRRRFRTRNEAAIWRLDFEPLADAAWNFVA